ncbi:MAG: DUF1876 domain-containing protein [Solirubrobacterales bacterium]|nr:DUF1876 domain-containing protein [Solirubrobacterales bacterium]
MSDREWQVRLGITEEDERTRADAVLELADQRFHGVGHAKRAPQDPSVPVIGQDLAASRALADLSHQLLEAAVRRIEDHEGHPVRLQG